MPEAGPKHRCKSCGQYLHELASALYAPWDERHLYPAPLYERLCWYKWQNADELGLVRAMVEHCSDGSILRASIPRLVVYSKLSKRRIQYLLNGREVVAEKTVVRKGKEVVLHARNAIQGLVERRILTCLAPANPKHNRPATYRLNEGALGPMDERMKSILERGTQRRLPGIPRPPRPDEPAVDAPRDDRPHAHGALGQNEPVPLPPRAHGAPGVAQVAAQQSVSPPELLTGDPRAHGAPASCTGNTSLVHTVHEPRAHGAPELLSSSSIPVVTTTTTSVDVEKVTETAQAVCREVKQPEITQSGINLMLAEVLGRAPDATTEEICESIRQKSKVGGIGKLSGFLITEVPEDFIGAAFRQRRRRQQAALQAATQAAALHAAAQAALQVEFEKWLDEWMAKHPKDLDIGYQDIPQRFWEVAKQREEEQRKAAQA